ncbi:hypothetical protein J6590_010739 [Homalodisca vitripennis]|nr:hypothetical protein J6590_010739 [Homalodisca vitripennis]
MDQRCCNTGLQRRQCGDQVEDAGHRVSAGRAMYQPPVLISTQLSESCRRTSRPYPDCTRLYLLGHPAAPASDRCLTLLR